MKTSMCERCTTAVKIEGERFCRACRQAVILEMHKAGYLQEVPTDECTPSRTRRKSKHKTRSTKRKHS